MRATPALPIPASVCSDHNGDSGISWSDYAAVYGARRLEEDGSAFESVSGRRDPP